MRTTGQAQVSPGPLQACRVLRQRVPQQGAGRDPSEASRSVKGRILCASSAQGLLCHPSERYQQPRAKTEKDPAAPPVAPDQQRRLHQGHESDIPDAATG